MIVGAKHAGNCFLPEPHEINNLSSVEAPHWSGNKPSQCLISIIILQYVLNMNCKHRQ